MLRHVALVRIDILEESMASIIMLTRIGELGTTLGITNNRAQCEEDGILNKSYRFVTMLY
jgi:hypothetical protein